MEKLSKKDQINRYTRNSPTKWKSRGFAMLPTSLLYDKNISSSCLVVFWVLTVHLFKGKSYCYPSTGLIAKEARLTRPTVSTALELLEKNGYLEIMRTKGKVNKYFLKVKV